MINKDALEINIWMMMSSKGLYVHIYIYIYIYIIYIYIPIIACIIK